MTRWRIDGFRAESALAQRCRLLLNPIRIVVDHSPAATKISAKSAAEVALSLIYILALLAQKLAKNRDDLHELPCTIKSNVEELRATGRV